MGPFGGRPRSHAGHGLPGERCRLGLPDQRGQRRAVDEGDVLAFGEGPGVRGEHAGGHHEAAGRALGGHQAMQLAHGVDGHFVRLPLLALHEIQLAVFVQLQVDAAIRAGAGFRHGVAVCAEDLAEEPFEFGPAHLAQGVALFALGCAARLLLALALDEVGSGGTGQQAERHEILAGRCQGLEPLVGGDVAKLAGRGLGECGSDCVAMQDAVSGDRQCEAQTPGQYACEFERALQDVVVFALCHGGDPPVINWSAMPRFSACWLQHRQSCGSAGDRIYPNLVKPANARHQYFSSRFCTDGPSDAISWRRASGISGHARLLLRSQAALR